jgi:glycosyltransferase involved in cell wall biosynthesis
MRAGLFLEALAADHEVSLLVVPVVADSAPPERPMPFVARHASRVTVVDLAGRRMDSHLALIARLKSPTAREAALRAYPRPLLASAATHDTVRAATEPFAGDRFDFVHVMRLYLAPFAAPWLEGSRQGPSRCLIDLDDDEVRTRRALAALHEANGDRVAAEREALEAERYAAFEREHLPRFDRALVASRDDRAEVEARLALGTVSVVPNAVRVPDVAWGTRPAHWRLLFVGSLGYPPNADAALWLCRVIVPRLRADAGRPVGVRIVGSRPPPDVVRLGELPGVTVAADVPSVAPYYAGARVAIAPIRAGGGTRIKVLEALAHRRPVVATRVAAAGLDVEDGVHFLAADDPERFADACLELLGDDDLAARLGESGRALVESQYAVSVVTRRIGELCRELLEG